MKSDHIRITTQSLVRAVAALMGLSVLHTPMVAAQVRMTETGGTQTEWISLQAPANIAANLTWTMPAADGSPNQCLATNGSGGLIWYTAGGGGGLPAADGSAGSPSINFTNSAGTGMFRAGTDILGVATAGVQRMTVLADGKVGIGITTPTHLFSVSGAAHETILDGQFVRLAGSPPNSPSVVLLAKTLPTTGQLIGVFGFGSGTVSSSQSTARMYSAATEGWTGSARGSNLVFQTVPNTTTTITTRMVINHDGNVGIGNTNPQAKLHINGNLRVDTLNAATATHLCIDANNVLSSCSSSIRYKENVQNLDESLDRILRLRPVTYIWKESKEKDVGFIAEEVEKVDARFVTYNKDNQIQGVKYEQLTAPIVTSIQEIHKILTETQSENAAMKSYLCSKDPQAPFCR